MKSQESLIEERKFGIDLCHKHLDTMQKNGISMDYQIFVRPDNSNSNDDFL